MCMLCAADVQSAGDMERRLHVLRLLALVEHPDALPPDAALRVSREIMSLADARVALGRPSDDLLARLELVYRDLHGNPELSMQEHRTSGIAADWLRQQGYEVTEGVGGTASSACCATAMARRCCCGPTWTRFRSRRAPAWHTPAKPAPTASTSRPDRPFLRTRHARRLADGATQILADNRDAWRGTIMAVFQPGRKPRRARGR